MKIFILSMITFLFFETALGFIPTKDQVSGYRDLISYLEKNATADSLKGLLDVYLSESSGVIGIVGGNSQNTLSSAVEKRYVYSKTWGWLDMKHVLASAYTSALPLISAKWAVQLGEIKERDQEEKGGRGAWDYEDLVSNLVGAFYPEFKKQFPELVQESELDTFAVYLEEISVINFPSFRAPNWLYLPLSSRTIQESHLIKNKTYMPMFTKQDPNSGSGVDRALVVFRTEVSNQ